MKEAAKTLLDLNPAHIVWGGDFNPRTEGLAEDTEAIWAGTTHPSGHSIIDMYSDTAQSYDPKKAH